MKNKRFYTDKDQGKLPEPGTPVDEAWKQMQVLLVKNNLTVQEKKNKRRTILLVLLFLFISITGTILYSLHSHDHAIKIVTAGSSNKKIQKPNNAEKSLIPDTTHQSIQPGIMDSVPPGNNKAGYLTGATSNNNLRLPVAHHHTPTNKNITEEQKSIPVNKEVNRDQPVEIKKDDKSKAENEAPAASQIVQHKKQDIVPGTNDSIKNTQPAFSKNKPENNSNQVKFHYGIQWNINFSLKNNSNYFDAYNGGKQYYMWALPAVWAKMNITKKHGITFWFNPFSQQFAGKQVVHVEKPFVASIEPDSVTSLIKSQGYHFGLNYEYNINTKITFAAGLGYSIQHNALYLEQAVASYLGNVLSESIQAVKKKDASFKYLNPTYLSWSSSLKYNFRKLSIGVGVTRPITNLSSNPDYNVRPLNGEFYLQYHLK